MITLERLAELAVAAYDGPNLINCHDDIAANVTEESGTFVVACRGTEISSFANIKRDLRVFPRFRWPGGLVHPGFWGGAQMIWEKIGYEIGYHSGPIAFTGHSLGAAMAICLASMARERGYTSTVLALAPPRVGGLTLRWSLRGCDVHLIWRANDLVPLVPWAPPIYLHPRRLTHINPESLEEPVHAHSAERYLADFKAYLSDQSGEQTYD